ncbi:hypothetical protein EIP86_011044 [Pleurotus ostreatoroseus]|nr:hypothetical protein EIP86_011044 [Pleurotus ostreatoroseus]
MPRLRRPSYSPPDSARVPTFTIDDFQQLVTDAFDLHKDSPALTFSPASPRIHSHTIARSRTRSRGADVRSYFDSDDDLRLPLAHKDVNTNMAGVAQALPLHLRPDAAERLREARPRSRSFSFVQRVVAHHHEHPVHPADKTGVAARMFKTLRSRASALVLRPPASASASTYGRDTPLPSPLSPPSSARTSPGAQPFPVRTSTSTARPRGRADSPFPFGSVEMSVSFSQAQADITNTNSETDVGADVKQRRRTSSLPVRYLKPSPSRAPTPSPLSSRAATPVPVSGPASVPASPNPPSNPTSEFGSSDKLFPRPHTPTPLRVHTRLPPLHKPRSIFSPLPLLSPSLSSPSSSSRHRNHHAHTHTRKLSTATCETVGHAPQPQPVDPVAYGLGLEFGEGELDPVRCPSPYKYPRQAPLPPTSPAPTPSLTLREGAASPTSFMEDDDEELEAPVVPAGVFERRGSAASGVSSMSSKSTQTLAERLSSLRFVRRARSKHNMALPLMARSFTPAGNASTNGSSSSSANRGSGGSGSGSGSGMSTESMPPTPRTPSFFTLPFGGSSTAPSTPSSIIQPPPQPFPSPNEKPREECAVGRVLTPEEDPFRKDDISVEGDAVSVIGVGVGGRAKTPTPLLSAGEWRDGSRMGMRRSWDVEQDVEKSMQEGEADRGRPGMYRSLTAGHRLRHSHQHRGSGDTVRGVGIGLGLGLEGDGVRGRASGDGDDKEALEEVGEWAVRCSEKGQGQGQERRMQEQEPFVFPAHPYAAKNEGQRENLHESEISTSKERKERRRPQMTIRPVPYREMQIQSQPEVCRPLFVSLTSTAMTYEVVSEQVPFPGASTSPSPYMRSTSPSPYMRSTSPRPLREGSPLPSPTRRVGSPGPVGPLRLRATSPSPSPYMRAASPSSASYIRATSPLPSPTKRLPPSPGPPPTVALPSLPVSAALSLPLEEQANTLILPATNAPLVSSPLATSIPLAPASPPTPASRIAPNADVDEGDEARAATPMPSTPSSSAFSSPPGSPSSRAPKRPPRSPRRRADQAIALGLGLGLKRSASMVPFPTMDPVDGGQEGGPVAVRPLRIQKSVSERGRVRVPRRPATADDATARGSVSRDRRVLVDSASVGQGHGDDEANDRPPTPFPMLSMLPSKKEKEKRPHTAEGQVWSLQDREAWSPRTRARVMEAEAEAEVGAEVEAAVDDVVLVDVVAATTTGVELDRDRTVRASKSQRASVVRGDSEDTPDCSTRAKYLVRAARANSSTVRTSQSDSALRASSAATATYGHVRSNTEEGYIHTVSALADVDTSPFPPSRFSSPSSSGSSIFPTSPFSSPSPTRRTSASPHAHGTEHELGQIEERWEGSPRSTAFYSARSSRASVWSTVSMAFGAFGVPMPPGGEGEEAVGQVRRSLCLGGEGRHEDAL